MVMPVGLAAASRLLASKGTREAVKKYGKKLVDQVKAYNSKNTPNTKSVKKVGGAVVRANNLMEQQKRVKKNRNISGRNKPKTTKSRTTKPRK